MKHLSFWVLIMMWSNKMSQMQDSCQFSSPSPQTVSIPVWVTAACWLCDCWLSRDATIPIFPQHITPKESSVGVTLPHSEDVTTVLPCHSGQRPQRAKTKHNLAVTFQRAETIVHRRIGHIPASSWGYFQWAVYILVSSKGLVLNPHIFIWICKFSVTHSPDDTSRQHFWIYHFTSTGWVVKFYVWGFSP